jgi:hypothetical protein
MIGDPRLVDKPYGRRIWQALPPMRRTRELADVLDFLTRKPGSRGERALDAAAASQGGEIP